MSRLACYLLVLLVFNGVTPVKAQSVIEYRFNDEFGGDFVASGFSGDENVFYIALPFRLEFYDLTGREITLLDSIDLPGIKAATVNNNLLAVAHRAEDRTRYAVSIIDLTTQTLMQPLLIQDIGLVDTMAFSPDNTRLAILSLYENYSRLFIIKLANPDDVIVYIATEEFSRLSQLEWSADGRYIATLEKGLVVFDTVMGQVSFETDIHMGESKIALHEANFIIYNTRRDIFWFYDLNTGSLSTYEIERRNPNWAFSWHFTPDYRYIIGREGMNSFIYPVPAEPGLMPRATALSESEMQIILSKSETGEANDAKILSVIGDQVFDITTSPSERYTAYRFLVIETDIYSAYKQQIAIVTLDEVIEEIRIIDRIFTPEIDGIYQAVGEFITVTGSCGVLNIDFSGSSSTPSADFVSGCGEVYDQRCGIIGESFMATSEFCYTEPGDMLEFSPDITITRLNDQGEPTDEQLVLQGHTGGLTGFSFSADESRLLTISIDNTVQLWSFVNETEELELVDVQIFGDGCTNLTDAAFNVDSSLIAIGDYTGLVRIYDANPASVSFTRMLQTLDTFGDEVRIAFTGNYLYTGSGGRIIQWK